MRFGLFGTGPWALMAHGPALAAHKDVELVGVWGRNPDKAAEIAARFGGRAYADADELIADVDAVAIALPPAVQAPIALRAASAGKHLLLDKPVALDPGEAAAVADAASRSGVASVVFFTRRLSPVVAGFLAEAAATEGWSEARVDHLGSIFKPDVPFGASPWRREKGGLWDVGPHALALVIPVLGPVTEVSAVAGPRDMTYVLARHAGGVVSSLTLSVDAAPGSEREEAFLAGEAGKRVVPQGDDAITAFGMAIDQLLATAAGGAASPIDVRFAAHVTAVLAAAQESARTGSAVAVAS
jgi:predicted dehydrogenase